MAAIDRLLAHDQSVSSQLRALYSRFPTDGRPAWRTFCDFSPRPPPAGNSRKVKDGASLSPTVALACVAKLMIRGFSLYQAVSAKLQDALAEF